MKLKYFFIVLVGFCSLHLHGQTDEPKSEPVPTDPFDQFEELFESFGLMQPGNGIMMDTMIIKQFGGDDFQSGDMDQMMKEMMEMMQMQMSQFDMESLDQMFEGFDFENFQPQEFYIDPEAPSGEEVPSKQKKTKKRKTYKL